MKTHGNHGSNSKLGRGVFVSTSSMETCPPSCKLKDNGCYAEAMPLRFHWNAVTRGEKGMEWDEFLHRIKSLKRGEFWRHNQAGDLPGLGDKLDVKALGQLVEANRGRRGFTYTHKPLKSARERSAVKAANAGGFTVNISSDNLAMADAAVKAGIGPVVTILPSNVQGKVVKTGAGNKVMVCPEYTKGWTCSQCQLCAVADRNYIIGFPSHGTRKKVVDLIASSTD